MPTRNPPALVCRYVGCITSSAGLRITGRSGRQAGPAGQQGIASTAVVIVRLTPRSTGRRRATPMACADHCLRTATQSSGPQQARDHPLPETVSCQRDLPPPPLRARHRPCPAPGRLDKLQEHQRHDGGVLEPDSRLSSSTGRSGACVLSSPTRSSGTWSSSTTASAVIRRWVC